ncbi:hypothetical protein J7L97_05910 [Candidatus Bathyarchaeota archaeon]|nr:hypothetical protein [Candidatus Bathyarchaeota archaeon]
MPEKNPIAELIESLAPAPFPNPPLPKFLLAKGNPEVELPFGITPEVLTDMLLDSAAWALGMGFGRTLMQFIRILMGRTPVPGK